MSATSSVIKKLLPGAAALACSGAALAHPGHEATSFAAGFAHPFSGLDHLLAMVAVGVWAAQSVGGGVAGDGRVPGQGRVQGQSRVLWAAPLAFIAAMLAGSLFGMAGAAVPLMEPMIAASVLVLGLLLALRVRAGLRIVPLVAAFALFHGMAHGAELHAEADASAAIYVAGFTAGTALLHLAGVGLGLLLRDRRFHAGLAGAPIALAGGLLLAQRLASL